MRYRRLRATELMVSEIGFGAFAIGGHMWGPVNDDDSLAALHRAFDLGVNFFDTADVYGHGHSEELIGKAFANCRPNALIATKVGFDFYSGEPARSNWDSSYIRGALERSLSRLNTDYIDLYQLHNPPQKLARDDAVWQTLADLKAEGKVRFYGVSARTTNDALAYLRASAKETEEGELSALSSPLPPPSPAHPEPVEGLSGARQSRATRATHIYGNTIQVAYNLLDQEAATKGVFDEAQRQDVGVISRVPLASGMLSGKYAANHRFPIGDFRGGWSPDRLEETVRRVEALRPLATEGRTLAQAAIAFALSQDSVSTVIVGAKTPAQVEENVAASDLPPLTESELGRRASL